MSIRVLIRYLLLVCFILAGISCNVADKNDVKDNQIEELTNDLNFNYSYTDLDLLEDTTEVQIYPRLVDADSYAYAIDPSLPDGLTLNPQTGYITGIATEELADTAFIVTASDGTYTFKTTITIQVTKQAPLLLSYPSTPLTWSINSAGSYIPTVTGGDDNIFTVTPALPSGLTLDPLTGVVAGTPTEATNQNYAFTVTNSAGSITQNIPVYVQNEVPAFSVASYTGSFTQSDPVSTLAAHPLLNAATIDINDVTYSIDPALPNGLTLDTSSGSISGSLNIGSIVGVHTYNYTAKSNAGQDTISLALTLNPNLQNLTYTLPSARLIEGQVVNLVPSYEGSAVGAITFSLDGSEPAGWTIDANTGIITGTVPEIIDTIADDTSPEALPAFVVSLEDAGTVASPDLTYTVSPNVVERDLHTLGYFSTYTFYTQIAGPVTHTPNPQAYSAPENQDSTIGATCDSSRSAYYATIGGIEFNTEATNQGYPFTFDCTNGEIEWSGDNNFNYDLTVTVQGRNYESTLTQDINLKVVDANIASAGYPLSLDIPYGTAYTPIYPTGVGAIIRSWSISPSLPTGLTFDTSNGQISGTPTGYVTDKPYTITASNHSDSISFTFQLTITGNAPTVLTMPDLTLTQCTDSTPGTTPTVDPSSTTPISYAVTPSLPPGLSLDSTTGAISGTPLRNLDTTTYTMTATNAHGADTDTFNIHIDVEAPLPPLTYSVSDFSITLDEVITNQLPDTGTSNSTCSSATNFNLYAFTDIDPGGGIDNWPNGLSVDANSGEISGTVATGDTTELINDIDPAQASNQETYQLDASYDDGGTTVSTTFTVTYYPQLPDISYVDNQLGGLYDNNDNIFNLVTDTGSPVTITATNSGGDVATSGFGIACGFYSVKGDNIATELTEYPGCSDNTVDLTGLPASYGVVFNYDTGAFEFTRPGADWCNVNTSLSYQVRGRNGSGYSPYSSVTFNIYDRLPTDLGYVANSTPNADAGDKLYVYDEESGTPFAGGTSAFIDNSALTNCSSTNYSYTSIPSLSDGGADLDNSLGTISFTNTGLVARQDYLITSTSSLPSALAETVTESIKVMNPYFGDDLNGMRSIVTDISGDGKEDIILITDLCDLGTAGCGSNDEVKVMVQTSDGSFDLSTYGDAIDATNQPRLGQAEMVKFLNTTSNKIETGLVFMNDGDFNGGAATFTIEVQSFITSAINTSDNTVARGTLVADDIRLAAMVNSDYDSGNNTTTLAAFHRTGVTGFIEHYTIGDDGAITHNNTVTLVDNSLENATTIHDMAIFHSDLWSTNSDPDLVILYEDASNRGKICIIKGSTNTFDTSCSTTLELPTNTDIPVQVIPANVANIGQIGLTDLVILDNGGVLYAYNNDTSDFATTVNPSWTYTPTNREATDSPIDLDNGREFAVKDTDNDGYPDVIYSYQDTSDDNNLYTFYNLYNPANPDKTLILPSVPHKISDVIEFVDDVNGAADDNRTNSLGLVHIKDSDGNYVDTAAIVCELATGDSDSFCSLPAMISELEY